MNYPNTSLTLSESPEVPGRSSLASADPHAACRALVPPNVGGRGDFWSKVVKTDCCWLWSGGCFDTGYGAVWSPGGKVIRAHRVAYELTVGPIPAGMDILHSCDVRRCCRPDHLEAGTRAKNQRDMVIRHRNAPQVGELNHNARFTETQVRMIRDLARLGYTRTELAAAFGTVDHYIGSLLKRRTWAHLDEAAS